MRTSDESATSRDLDPTSSLHTTLAVNLAVEQDQRLLTISEIAKISVTEHSTEAMLQKLLACLIETLEVADTGVLLLHDPDEDLLSV